MISLQTISTRLKFSSTTYALLQAYSRTVHSHSAGIVLEKQPTEELALVLLNVHSAANKSTFRGNHPGLPLSCCPLWI